MIPTSILHLFVSHLCIHQAFSVTPTKRAELLRRNTEGVWRIPDLPSPPFLSLPRRRFKKAVTTALAVIRLKNLMENKSNGDEDDPVQPTPGTSLPRRRFRKAVTTTLAVIRLKSLMEKRSNGDKDDPVQPTPSTSGQQLFCGRCKRACDFTKAPNIVCRCFPLPSSLSTYDILV